MVKTMRKCLYASVMMCVACGSSEPVPRPPGSGGEGGGSGAAGGGGVSVSVGGSSGTTGGSVSAGDASGIIVIPVSDAAAVPDSAIVTSLPPGFTQTEVGGYQLGTPLVDGSGVDAGATGNRTCGNILLGVLRDFKGRNESGGHPDFEGPLYGNDVTLNLVLPELGADQKPIYASKCEEGRPSPAPICQFGAQTTTVANFDQWYRYTANVNKPYLLNLYFAPQNNGLFTFQSLFFYPLDNAGWGNSGIGKEGRSHNFAFTTELHTQFKYNGGETFSFDGDDDVWVFINNHLAVDVGGLHPRASKSVSLDVSAQRLGIITGNVYNLDLFHAERHTPESTFRIDTNLAFVNCGTVPPDIPR